MEAVILAGGFGTRLREVVPDCPKPMAPVAGRPFLEILLKSLARKGVTRVVLSLGFMAGRISEHFGASFAGIAIDYVVEDSPLGTGGATRLAMAKCSSDHVFVLNGDTYLDLELSLVDARWADAGHPIIVAREVPDTMRYGRLETCHGAVTGFAEKGIAGPGLINAGCYVLNRGQLDGFPPGSAFSLETDYLAAAVREARFDVFVTQGKFIDIGVPDEYRAAQTYLAEFAL